MARYFRPLQAILLALVLTLTAQSMAVARGMARPVGEIILCTGAGAVVVRVDNTGAPDSPVHICPDCALVDVFADQSDAVEALQSVWGQLDTRRVKGPATITHELIPPSARAPPLPV